MDSNGDNAPFDWKPHPSTITDMVLEFKPVMLIAPKQLLKVRLLTVVADDKTCMATKLALVHLK